MELLWVLGLSPLILFPGRGLPRAWYPVVVAALLLGAGVSFILRRGRSARTPGDWCLLAMLAWLPVTYWASVDKQQTWVALGYLLLGMAWFAAWTHQAANWAPWALAALLMAAEAGLAVLGPLLVDPLPTWAASLRHLQTLLDPWLAPLGETINPNVLAGGLVLVMPIPLALAVARPRKLLRRLPFLLLSLAALGALSITDSRGAYLATAAAIGGVLLLCWPRLLYALPLLLLALGLGVRQVGPGAVLDALFSANAVGGLSGRLEIWSRALFAIQDSPFVGIGFGLFGQVIPLVYPYSLQVLSGAAPHAHNLLLQIGVDMGMPGLVAWLAFQGVVLWMLVRVLRTQPRGTDAWALAAGVLGGLIAMHVHGLVDATTWASRVAVMPWFLYALVVLLYHDANRPHAPTAP